MEEVFCVRTVDRRSAWVIHSNILTFPFRKCARTCLLRAQSIFETHAELLFGFYIVLHVHT